MNIGQLQAGYAEILFSRLDLELVVQSKIIQLHTGAQQGPDHFSKIFRDESYKPFLPLTL